MTEKYILITDLIVIVFFTTITSFNDKHVYFYSPAASELAAVEGTVPHFMLVSTIVYCTAALIILYSETKTFDLPRHPYALVVAAGGVGGGLFYWYTGSDVLSIFVGVYTVAMGALFINREKIKLWETADYTFRWLVDLLIFISIHSYIPPELGQNVRNSVSFSLGTVPTKAWTTSPADIPQASRSPSPLAGTAPRVSTYQ